VQKPPLDSGQKLPWAALELFTAVLIVMARRQARRELHKETAMSNVSSRQDPWTLVPRLQEEINRLFGNVHQSDSSSATASWVPPVDIYEYVDRFELYVDVPGVDPNKVELTLDGGVLTLSGQRKEPNGQSQAQAQAEEPQYRRVERGVGHFYRRFVLPDTVDGEKVNAAGKDGVLRVTIPKQPKAMPRRIQIDA